MPCKSGSWNIVIEISNLIGCQGKKPFKCGYCERKSLEVTFLASTS